LSCARAPRSKELGILLLKALAEVFSFSTAAHLALKSRIKIPSIFDVWKHTVFLGYSLFFFVGWTYKP
jgi:hypothetical protein